MGVSTDQKQQPELFDLAKIEGNGVLTVTEDDRSYLDKIGAEIATRRSQLNVPTNSAPGDENTLNGGGYGPGRTQS